MQLYFFLDAPEFFINFIAFVLFYLDWKSSKIEAVFFISSTEHIIIMNIICAQ